MCLHVCLFCQHFNECSWMSDFTNSWRSVSHCRGPDVALSCWCRLLLVYLQDGCSEMGCICILREKRGANVLYEQEECWRKRLLLSLNMTCRFPYLLHNIVCKIFCSLSPLHRPRDRAVIIHQSLASVLVNIYIKQKAQLKASQTWKQVKHKRNILSVDEECQ